ncbi:S-layer homology domain-containing protein [Brachybacterium sp. sponge]|uniref:S-layer homology domain-containing protein n=1 Tax=Brachybacterium sp. sponge TaxID=1775432 RepID=UPI0018D3FABD|nr:S-layer homology domain-containing protein [Brachybacterium sp. sponge]
MPGHLPGTAQMPRRLLFSTLIAGLAGTSLCALPAPSAHALPAPTKGGGVPKYVTDRNAFWALPVLETGMDLGIRDVYGFYRAYVPLTLDQGRVREAAISAIQTLRRELFAREDMLYQGMPLRAWLLRNGNVRDAETFAAQAQWDSRLELASLQRVAELVARFSTTRPTGFSGFSMKQLGSKYAPISVEYIARGDASAVYQLLLQTWGRDQVPALIASGGKKAEGCSELWWMLNAESAQLGVAVTTAGGNVHATFRRGLSGSAEVPSEGSYRVQIGFQPGTVKGLVLHAPKLMMIGDTAMSDLRTPSGIRPLVDLFTTWGPEYLDTTPEGQINANAPGVYEVSSDIQVEKYRASIEVRRFTDVPVKNVFFREIEDVAIVGIARGWDDGTYRPGATVSRDVMAAFLYRLAKSPSFTPPKKSPFRDVSPRHVFYKEISWLAHKKISTGWPDGTYRPAQAVTREEMAAFMYRLAGSPNPKRPGGGDFVDVPASAGFARPIRFMAENGISRGWGKWPRFEYRPKEPILRDAMAAFLSRYKSRAEGDGFF